MENGYYSLTTGIKSNTKYSKSYIIINYYIKSYVI